MIGQALMTLVVALSLPAPGHAADAHAGKPVMGTVLQVFVEAEDTDTAAALAEQGISLAARWDDVLTTWRAEGELARLNASAGKGAFAASGELRAALSQMARLARATDGAFNPAIGAQVERWRKSSSVPLAAPAQPFHEAVRVERQGVVLAAGTALDAGAIGKGIALDAMARALKASGASSLWLDFGGSSQLGWSEGRRPRTIVVAGLATGVVHGTLEVGDAAVSTSRAAASREEGPILDPRTGQAIAERRLATVLATDATTADAWSTALVVLGRDGIAKARAAGCEVLFEDDEGLVVSPGFWSGQAPRRVR